jgi:hypothetical protein
MDRRSLVSTLAGALAGVSLGPPPKLEAAASFSGEPFSVTRGNLAESSGLVTCPGCEEMWDSLDLTPAGLCLRCSDAKPTLRAEPHSDTFWKLSHQEIRRVEAEIERLAAELDRMNARFAALNGSDGYNRAMEAGRDEWHAVQRELHLLHLLRAASRQFA